MFMRTYASSRVKRKSFYRKSELQMFFSFPAGILVHQNCAPIWRLHTKLYKGAWNVSANNSETVGHKDLRLGQIAYILVFYNISFSWLLPLDGFQFIFFVAWQWKRSIRRLGWWQPCCRDYRFLNKGDQRSLLAIVNHEKISLKLIEAFRYKTT